MNEQSCFVYDSTSERPAKKRRIEHESKGLDSSLKLRKDLFQHAWDRQQANIEKIVRQANKKPLRQIERLVSASTPVHDTGRLNTGLLLTGPGSGQDDTFFKQIGETLEDKDAVAHALISGSECSNLKNFLKALIHKVTRQSLSGEDEDEIVDGWSNGRKLLGYDLQILHEFYKSRGLERVALIIPDSESLEVSLLAEIVSLLHSWRDRIKVDWILGIATSIDVFNSRLPRSTLKLMRQRSIMLSKSDDMLERLFRDHVSNVDSSMRLGPGLSELLLRRQAEHIKSVESFTQSVKYAYMSHYHGNPITVFLSNDIHPNTIDGEHFEAIRNLPSFRRHAESLLQRGHGKLVKEILDSDDVLYKEIQKHLEHSRDKITWCLGAATTIREVQVILQYKIPDSFSTLYILAMSGALTSSSLLRELFMHIKKAVPEAMSTIIPKVIDVLMRMPPEVVDVSPDDFGDLQEQLTKTRAEDDAQSGKKRNKAQISKKHAAYSQLATKLHDLLRTYFDKALCGYQQVFLHEILFYDLKAPHREAFMPRPRFAIERALSSPHDYLGCNCCAEAEGLSATQPATAVLYQLYLESGSLINAFDLWSAFQTIVGDRYESEQMTMALFFRALAELKCMGFVKPSKKRTDHVAKLAWKGL
ncbi:MAG: hypothetical protein M1831_000444 [Alyxoria varia]|nr:MAG: hypothetical protein M1831_000444 [Alyxoria varia]